MLDAQTADRTRGPLARQFRLESKPKGSNFSRADLGADIAKYAAGTAWRHFRGSCPSREHRLGRKGVIFAGQLQDGVPLFRLVLVGRLMFRLDVLVAE